MMNQKIKDRELSKYYLCVVQGRMAPKEGKLEGYLFKDEVKKQVYVRGRPEPGAKTAVTLYKTLAVKNGLSWWSATCSPGGPIRSVPNSPMPDTPSSGTASTAVSGRIESMAAMGRPCTPISSPSTSPPMPGPLEHLNGRTFQVEDVDFVREYFGAWPEAGERAVLPVNSWKRVGAASALFY